MAWMFLIKKGRQKVSTHKKKALLFRNVPAIT